MLSKMMLPDEATFYKSTLYSERLKNTEKSLSTAMKDTKINTDDCCNKKKTKGGSNNWQKFKHIATADDTKHEQKSAPKRQLTNSNNSTINNKRKACSPKNTVSNNIINNKSIINKYCKFNI